MADEAILSLEPIKRDFIRINGEGFEIYAPDELSVEACQEITRDGALIGELSAKHDKASHKKMAKLIDEVAHRAFVEIPDEVFDKIPGFQRMQIVSVFTGLLLRQATGLAGATARAVSGLAGVKPSSGSSGSLAGLPTGGGAARPSGT
ncbi:hypothetical protein AWH62_00975 [Maricaulis sp. W15]|uniref:hypothetical protein n=1 Tax=Maricaulis sp. W15 TaxID=1772333 RepID=UPI0009491B8E|nr:hypothetical protein [Maricaulis sp. W15]OLF81279.1 hypothetical protein AWH62_00975 [Maricaulis sp. W15]